MQFILPYFIFIGFYYIASPFQFHIITEFFPSAGYLLSER